MGPRSEVILSIGDGGKRCRNTVLMETEQKVSLDSICKFTFVASLL